MNELKTLFQFYTCLIFLISYLMGSIPFGLVFTRLGKLGDVRKIGSGNIGATNVLRTGSKKLAALTLLCDVLKGTVTVLIVKNLSYSVENNIIIILAGFFAFLGHLFPIWLKFKGGKGVATYLGVCLGYCWPVAIFFIVVWVAFFLITRYSSLSALVAVISTPMFIYFFYPYLYAYYILLTMSIFVIIKHYSNIGRLLIGKEKKVGIQNGNE
ncbi:glycerol-3-phosphate 1-O-acyltransferase PlsY [Bartonella sp. CB169]|uniref:glycerol-3-phosphate 1-O-acyltransferase PlsY n=1 Tax=Bartonella sp. CB169 TaxID=3112257 RepID=UPI00300E376B